MTAGKCKNIGLWQDDYIGVLHYKYNGICGTQEKEIKGGPAVGHPRLRRVAHGCRGIP